MTRACVRDLCSAVRWQSFTVAALVANVGAAAIARSWIIGVAAVMWALNVWLATRNVIRLERHVLEHHA